MTTLSQLRFAVSARTARDPWGSATAAEGELRKVRRRVDALLRELRRRGVDVRDGVVASHRPRMPAPWAAVRRASVERTEPLEPLDAVHTIEQLKRGLVSRGVIGQAQGILMERHGVSADRAFRMLVEASQRTNRKLVDLAADLVTTGTLPGCQRPSRRRRPTAQQRFVTRGGHGTVAGRDAG